MQFQSEANGLDLVSDIKYWCGIPSADTTTYPIKDITRNANFGLANVISLIKKNDKQWVWDDSNDTDLPIATTDLVVDQRDYSLDISHLKITRVRIKDSSGNFITIYPVNREEIGDATLNAPSGFPTCYVKMGRSILLYPACASGMVTLSGGLEVQFERGANYFAYTDTTKAPGFDEQFHRLVSLYAARDYLMANDVQNRLTRVETEIFKREQELIRFFSDRARDTKKKLTMRGKSYR